MIFDHYRFTIGFFEQIYLAEVHNGFPLKGKSIATEKETMFSSSNILKYYLYLESDKFYQKLLCYCSLLFGLIFFFKVKQVQ